MWKSLRYSQIVDYYRAEDGRITAMIQYSETANGGSYMWHVAAEDVCVTNNGKILAFAR